MGRLAGTACLCFAAAAAAAALLRHTGYLLLLLLLLLLLSTAAPTLPMELFRFSSDGTNVFFYPPPAHAPSGGRALPYQQSWTQ